MKTKKNKKRILAVGKYHAPLKVWTYRTANNNAIEKGSIYTAKVWGNKDA